MAHALEKDEVRSVLFANYYKWADSQDEGLTIDRRALLWVSRCKEVCADIRHAHSQSIGSANLIVYHGFANIVHQIIELLCVFGIAQELCNILLSRHRV